MKIEHIRTEDGSDSLFLPEMNENYHSTKGAIQESNHVFINAGLCQITKQKIAIAEVGMGTGLNVLLTALNAQETGKHIRYTTIEKHPLPNAITQKLNYPKQLGGNAAKIFRLIHDSEWGRQTNFNAKFNFHKINISLLDWLPSNMFDLVYFDAFGPDKQPEMWQQSVYDNLFNNMNNGGILVTYSAKGDVRRGLQKSGFQVEKIAGPPGKLHMTRATKPY